jgi:hypothetical protein
MRLWTLLGAVLALAGGCASSPQSRYYVLTPAAGASAPANAQAPSLAVGPVTVPALVDQPQFVLLASGNQVTLAEYHRWGSPLRSEIARVIGANLSQELGAARVWSYLQTALPNPDIQVLVDVRRFDSKLGEGVSIDVLWGIRRKAGEPVRAGQSVVNEPAAGASYDDLAAAHSRALAQVSRDIAAAIRNP